MGDFTDRIDSAITGGGQIGQASSRKRRATPIRQRQSYHSAGTNEAHQNATFRVQSSTCAELRRGEAVYCSTRKSGRCLLNKRYRWNSKTSNLLFLWLCNELTAVNG